MDALGAALGEMLKAYPDPDGPRPIANYPATMYGVTITFHVGRSRYHSVWARLTDIAPQLGSGRLSPPYTHQSRS
jgi:hypothetical protein